MHQPRPFEQQGGAKKQKVTRGDLRLQDMQRQAEYRAQQQEKLSGEEEYSPDDSEFERGVKTALRALQTGRPILKENASPGYGLRVGPDVYEEASRRFREWESQQKPETSEQGQKQGTE